MTTVTVHLTEFAPRCLGLPLGHEDRWRHFAVADPSRAVRATLRRLGLGASRFHVAVFTENDVALMAAPPVDMRQYLPPNEATKAVPWAVFAAGLDMTEVTRALASIADANVRDGRPLSSPPLPLEGDPSWTL